MQRFSFEKESKKSSPREKHGSLGYTTTKSSLCMPMNIGMTSTGKNKVLLGRGEGERGGGVQKRG